MKSMKNFMKVVLFGKDVQHEMSDAILKSCYAGPQAIISYYAHSDDEAAEFLSYLSSLKSKCSCDMELSVTDYVIVTSHKDWFSKHFVANNIIDVTGKSVEKVIADVKWVMSGFDKTECKKNAGLFFYSDTHYSHKKIIQYCNRPWNEGRNAARELVVTDENVVQMNAELVKRYNEVVGTNDVVYFLGDVAFGKKENVKEFISQLNGKKLLVKGNHDHHKNDVYLEAGFSWVYDRPIVIKDFMILSHAPLQFLNSNCPFYNVFGHVHDSEMYKTWTRCGCCACVERHDYRPVSFDEIMKKYNELNGNEQM